MTTARQKRKQLCAALGALLGLALVLSAVVAGGVPVSRAAAAVTERIVVDWHTGLAISGYDPVAFFTDGKPTAGSADGKPTAGSAELEMRYGGAIWRFCNPGNRAAFAARPDVYMPMAAMIRSAWRTALPSPAIPMSG